MRAHIFSRASSLRHPSASVHQRMYAARLRWVPPPRQPARQRHRETEKKIFWCRTSPRASLCRTPRTRTPSPAPSRPSTPQAGTRARAGCACTARPSSRPPAACPEALWCEGRCVWSLVVGRCELSVVLECSGAVRGSCGAWGEVGSGELRVAVVEFLGVRRIWGDHRLARWRS